jgi:hypothetical protein
MDNSRFSILTAVREAYVFVGREWVYLFKAGLLPMGLQLVTAFFVHFQLPDASPIEAYLWGLPATVLFSWFIFAETRLLLLGERLHALPADPAHLARRRRAMQASVASSLLFNMGIVAALSLLLTMEGSAQWKQSPALTAFSFALLALLFWALRFGVVPLLAAVEYPLRPVLQQVRGAMFSLRLMGMAIICVLPVTFAFRLFVSSVVAGAAVDAETPLKLTEAQQAALIGASAPVSLLIAALLTAAAVSALRQILGRSQRDLTA